MPLLSKPAFGPRTAIVYITVGALIDVWTAVWYFTYARNEAGVITRDTWFWLTGLFLTGLILVIIGVFLGEIGRSARKAELPPEEATAHEAQNPQPVGVVPQNGPPMMAMPMMMPPQPVQPVQPGQPAPPPPPQYTPNTRS